MLSDGLYSVHFKTQIGEGAGVAYLSGGKVRGGDSAIAYVGTYMQGANDFSAEVKTTRHFQGMPSVFGRDEVTIRLVGTVNGNSILCAGTAAEAPGLGFQATLTKIDD